MRFIAITLCLLWCLPAYALTVQEHAADSSNPHGGKMKITQKLNVGTDEDYATNNALKVQGGATIDSLKTSTLSFGTASSVNGSLSIGTTTAGSSRIRVIGTITATTFVGDGTFLTGVGAGTGSGNWTDSGSSTQTLYPDTITRKVAVGSTTTNGNQFAVDGTARVYGTLTATYLVGNGAGLTNLPGSSVAFSAVTGSATASQLPPISGLLGSATATQLPLSLAGMTFTGNTNFPSGIWNSTGSVGIGTSTPTTTLHVIGTVTATGFVGDGSLLTGISTGDGTETIWVNNGSTTSQGTVTQNIVLGSTTAAANQKLTVVGSSTFRDTYIGGNLAIGTAGSSLIGGTPTIKLAIGDNDSGLRHISDGIYALVANSDDQIIIDGTTDKVYIGTSTGDTKLFVKDDIKATGTITATYLVGNGAGITGITDAKLTDTGTALRPGTVTYNIVIGTTTENGAQLQVQGSATVSGSITANMFVGNAPSSADEDDIVNGSDLATVKAELVSEWVGHTVSTSDIHGVGSSTIASMEDVDSSISAHDGSVTAHYAISTAVANTPILRDGNGRAQIATGTSSLDIANVGQAGTWKFVRVGLSSGSANTPVYFVTDAEVGSKSAYLVTFFGKVNGATTWTAGTMTKVEILDSAGLNLFVGITLAELGGNAEFIAGKANVGHGGAYLLKTGGGVGKGMYLVADGTATGGSTLYITALIRIE